MGKIKLLFLISLLLLIIGCTSEKNRPKLWAWSHPHNDWSIEQWDSVLSLMQQHHFKGLLLSADTHALTRVIPLAQKYDIEVHAWMWTLNRGDAKKEWLSVNALGNSLAEQKAYVDYYKFMCPALPEVREFIGQKVEQLYQIDGLSGVHLDYIRYVDVFLPIGLLPKYDLVQDSIMPEFDYGYHPYLIKKFKDQFAYHPKSHKNYPNDSIWMQFRMDQVTELVNGLVPLSEKYDKVISAAVFPDPEMSSVMVRQEWNQWDINKFFPMVYYNFYNEKPEWVNKTISKGKNLVSSKPIICGLYLPGINSSADLTSAMNHAISAGAEGISFFELSSLKQNDWNAIKKLTK